MIEFVSLGSMCSAAMLLKRLGLGRYGLPITNPMPFDWIFSDIDMIIHCLEDNFRTLLDKNFYKMAPEYNGMSEVSHQLYRPYPLALFTHFDPTTKMGYYYLERCVERLIGILDDDTRKLFVIIMPIHPHERADVVRRFSRLCDAIHARTRNAAVLGFSMIKDTTAEQFVMNTDLSVDADTLYNFRHRSVLVAAGFDDDAETATLDEIVLQKVAQINNNAEAFPAIQQPVSAWPRPCFSQRRMEELRQRVSLGEARTIEVKIAKTKLLAAEGDTAAAGAILEEICKETPPDRVHHGVRRTIVTAALQSGNVNCAEYYLRKHDGATGRLHFEITEVGPRSAQHVSVVTVIFQGNHITCRFEPTIFSEYSGDGMLERFADVFPLLEAYAVSPDRQDGEVALNLGDAGARSGLAFCEYRPGYYLVPDPFFMESDAYRTFKSRLHSKWVEWDDRRRQALWRGSTTGLMIDPRDSWRSLPRIKLCAAACERPDLFDVGVTSAIQVDDPAAAAWLQDVNMLRPFVAADRFQEYRYQIDIDGNTNSWAGLFTKLLTGSPVLKVESPSRYQQWYYHRLKPWVNFVPVAYDMVDLIEKVEWLRDNDAAARKIGEAGRELALSIDWEAALDEGIRTIAAAISEGIGTPAIDIDFSASPSMIDHLQAGWRELDPQGVEAVDFVSSIKLPKPPCLGDYILISELSPLMGRAQRLAVVVNGEIVLQKRLEGRATLYCPLPASLVEAAETFEVGFLHPDASVDGPGARDGRFRSIKLHRLAVAPASMYSGDENLDLAATLAVLGRLPHASSAHDLYGPDSPLELGIELKTLRTFHGTIVYADLQAGRLRHGPADKVPHNLLIAQTHETTRLFRTTVSGYRFSIRLRPEGPHSHRTNDAERGQGVSGFELVVAEGVGSETFGLRGGGLFLCAELHGEVTLSRAALGGWERFSSDR